MVEIRIHGRGGQGSVVLAELLAVAAWQEGKYSQAFPYLGGGGERRGAPVQAFARMSDRPIRLRCRVQSPDYVLVQDPALVDLVDVTRGMKPGGLILVNGEEVPARLAQAASFRVRVVPATRLALEATGKALTNTAMLGVFAAGTGELSLSSVLAAVRERFSGEIGEMNARAVEAGYRAAAAAAGAGGGRSCCCDAKEEGRRCQAVSLRLNLGAVVEPGTSRAYLTGQWRLTRPVVNEERCNGCGVCEFYCPDVALTIGEKHGGQGKVARINYDYCKGCGICAVECPRKAIEMVPEVAEASSGKEARA